MNGSLLFYWFHKQLESTPISRNVQKSLPLRPYDYCTAAPVATAAWRGDTLCDKAALSWWYMIHGNNNPAHHIDTLDIIITNTRETHCFHKDSLYSATVALWHCNNYSFTQIFLFLDSDQHNLFSHNKALKLDKCLLKMFADDPNTTNNQNVICCCKCKTTFLIFFSLVIVSILFEYSGQVDFSSRFPRTCVTTASQKCEQLLNHTHK